MTCPVHEAWPLGELSPRLDRIARLAASIGGAPVAAIVLGDCRGAAVRAVWGISLSEAQLEISLWGLAGELARGVTWTELARQAFPTAANQGKSRLRFCAGAPILQKEEAIGMLCIGGRDADPPAIGESELAELRELAALAAEQIRMDALRVAMSAAGLDPEGPATRFSAVADAVSDAILTMDEEGAIRYANQAAWTVLGRYPEAIVGQSICSIFGQETLDRLRRYFRTKIRTLDWHGTHLTIQRPSGESVPVEISIGEFEENAGQRLAVVVRDHSDQERLRKEKDAREREFREILENLQEVVFRTDGEGRWTFLNPAWTKLTGFSVAESLGRPFVDFVPPEERDHRLLSFQGVTDRDCTVISHECRYRCSDGADRWMEVHARRLVDAQGRALGACGTLHDIHQRRLAEERRKEALEYAERCNAAKNEFLSRVSHELRTPMNAVLGFAQLLEMEELPNPQGRMVGQILACGRHLLALLDDVIDISRIESGKLQLSLEPVRLAGAVGATLDLMRPQAEGRGIRLSAGEISGEILADSRRLAQILFNLLSNAVKYNRQGGSIDVWTERKTEGRIAVLIRDTGPGLTPEQISRLFQPFERLGADRTSVPGTGLGLSVARHLTELQGGKLEVDSEVGVGSTFRLEFNLSGLGPSPRRAGLAADRCGAGNQKTVLWIGHPDGDSREPAEIQNELPGFRLLTAASGDGGFAQVCEELPDLILLDWQPGDGSGTELARLLRGNPLTETIPLMVLASAVAGPSRQELEEIGVDDWLEQPLNPGQLMDAVNRHLERHAP